VHQAAQSITDALFEAAPIFREFVSKTCGKYVAYQGDVLFSHRISTINFGGMDLSSTYFRVVQATAVEAIGRDKKRQPLDVVRDLMFALRNLP
jgi:hypothetical protein